MRPILALAMIALTVASAATAPVPVMDLHSDILLRVIDNGVDIGDEGDWPQVTLQHARQGNLTEQVFAIWVDDQELPGFEATARALEMRGCFEQQANRHADRMALARSMAEAREIVAADKLAVFLWLEGGAPINSDLDMLRAFYDVGVRGMTLTWMNNLPWAGSSTDHDNPEMGLTDFGRDVVREMNRLGMLVDLSHVSDQTFYDAIAVSTDPVVISHSDCKALFDHPRNVTDDMLRALAENGGVIGINVYPGYISPTWEAGWDATDERFAEQFAELAEQHGGRRAPAYREARRLIITANLPEESRVTIDDYLDHMEHAIEVAGYEHVGLGSDFDGLWAFPEGIETPADWQNVAEGLRSRGHSEEEVAAIMGGNVRRVFEQVLDRPSADQ